MHFALDFTTPFGVGDEVYTTYPSGDANQVAGPRSHNQVKARVVSIKLIFELEAGNSCTVSQALEEKNLQVQEVIYTVLPLEPDSLSAFQVHCSTQADEPPKLFAGESQLRSHQAKRS